MKIIQDPDPILCPSCRCRFSYDNKDVRVQTELGSIISNPSPLIEGKRLVICPICNRKIYLV